jgi:hypothetical protein
MTEPPNDTESPGQRAEAALRSRYPKWFDRRSLLSIDLPDGWAEIVTRLCDDVAAALGPEAERLRLRQIKSKFGVLRVYWRHPNSALRTLVGDRVAATKAKSQRTCEVCSSPASLCVGDLGWLATLCEHHCEELGFTGGGAQPREAGRQGRRR